MPFAFVTVWELTKSMTASLFATSFILWGKKWIQIEIMLTIKIVVFLLDVGMITLNQYILLDPILLFFMSGAVMGMVKVQNHRDRSFSFSWWFWLSFTGFMLAGAISVKFVGLFVVSLVGLYTIAELWDILGDLSQPVVCIFLIFQKSAIVIIFFSFFFLEGYNSTFLSKSTLLDCFSCTFIHDIFLYTLSST